MLTCFVTFAHEIALRNLGAERVRRVRDRRQTLPTSRVMEEEIMAYLVSRRNWPRPRSKSYHANSQGDFSDFSLFAVARTANAVETSLGVSAVKRWNEKA